MKNTFITAQHVPEQEIPYKNKIIPLLQHIEGN